MTATPPSIGQPLRVPPEPPVDNVLAATERLRQSRRRMRDQMLEFNASSAPGQAAHRGAGASGELLAALAALPVLGPLIDSAANWWANHPLRSVAELFTKPGTSTAKPLTERHPWAIVLGAAAVGALLMWARPWRFALLRRALYTGVLPQVVTTLLSRVSTEGLLDLLHSALRRPDANQAAPTAPGPQSTGPEDVAPQSTLH